MGEGLNAVSGLGQSTLGKLSIEFSFDKAG